MQISTCPRFKMYLKVIIFASLALATATAQRPCSQRPGPPPPTSGNQAPFNASCPSTTPAQNKKFVLEAYESTFNQQDFASIDRYYASNYFDHNRGLRGDLDSLKQLLPNLLDQSPKGNTVLIAATAADGDRVWIHSKLAIKGTFHASAEIFRVACGKIVEHWDVGQVMGPSNVNVHPYF